MAGSQGICDRTPADLLVDELARSADLTPFAALVEPLLAYDRERRSNPVRTLQVYFAAGANASEAADRLFLHRDSMLYRLARVEQLTGYRVKRSHGKLGPTTRAMFVG
jgi:DNA-binding PucR family transcriptional regulator